MRVKLLIAGAALLPSLASAATPLHLAPIGPWVVDYADDNCRLLRRFGDGKDQTVLDMESEAPGALDMTIMGRPLGAASEETSVNFVPVPSEPMEGLVAVTSTGTPSIVLANVVLFSADYITAVKREPKTSGRPPAVGLDEQAARKAARLAFATATTGIQINTSARHPVVLDTGSLGGAIEAFDKCSRDSLRDWGVDPDLEDKIVRPPWAQHPERWFSSSDYPGEAQASGEESIVRVRLLVDATGAVTKCTSLSHFMGPEFKKVVCDNFIRRAHFAPAELADGTKVPSYYINTIQFRLAP